jgi:hypothetical protein
MRPRLSLIALLAGLGIAALVTATLGGVLAAPGVFRFADLPGSRTAGEVEVDVELVLAVDISYSMDYDELALQRDGYIEAVTSTEFLNALRQGMHGKVAVTYVEWAGASDQRVVVPWQVIEGPASAEVFAAAIAAAPLRRSYRTSISGVLLFSTPMFDGNGFRGLRRVIDVSGDGANNQGTLVTVARDQALEKGITINGLPITMKRLNFATMDIPNLDVYYEDCVIGGPGAFVVPVQDRAKFKEAIRTKLVMEIASPAPQARIIPAAANAPRVSCTIGERLWQERWGGGIDSR